MRFTAQTTLTKDAPVILDATCSRRRIWPAFATVRIDIRPEMNPDIVMDATKMKFGDHRFDKIYCDPPHLIAKSINFESLHRARKRNPKHFGKPIMMEDYGFWKSREDWLAFVKGTNSEFYRVLKPTGELHYKIAERMGAKDSVQLHELLDGMTNFTVAKSRTTKSGARTKSNGRTHWITFEPTDTKDGGIGGR